MSNKQIPTHFNPTHVMLTPNGLVPVRINVPTAPRPNHQPVRRPVPFVAGQRPFPPIDTSILDDEPLDKLVQKREAKFSNPRKRTRKETETTTDARPREHVDLNLKDAATVREARPSKIPRLKHQSKAIHQEIDKMMPEFTAMMYKTFLRQHSADGAYEAMRMIIQLHIDLKQIK